MKTNKLVAFGATIIGAILLFVVVAIINAPGAAAATRTWDGGDADNNMTTAANWSGDVAPVAADDLVFPMSVSDKTVVNDFTAGTSFNSITFNGTSSSSIGYSISGNQIDIAGNITSSYSGTAALPTIATPLSASSSITIVTDDELIISGVISGSGTIAKQGASTLQLLGVNTFTSTLTIQAGILFAYHASALGTVASATILNGSTARLIFSVVGTSATVAEPITMTETDPNALAIYFSACGSTEYCPDYTATFTGTLTLGEDIIILTDEKVAFTGPIIGNYMMSLRDNTNGSLVLNSSSNGSALSNGTYRSAPYELTYATSSSASNIFAKYNATLIVTGTVGTATVFNNGTLKGTGTVVGDTTVLSGGTVAPGLSPGCLTVGNLVSAGTIDIEIGGADACSGYDQLRVNGTVNLTGSELGLTLVNGFVPAADTSFVIIQNDGVDAVIGTFNDLPEGAAFEYDGVVYDITYTGGDGNDVELYVLEIVGSPDTGFGLIKNNPIAVAVVTTASAIAIALIARKYNLVGAKSRS